MTVSGSHHEGRPRKSLEIPHVSIKEDEASASRSHSPSSSNRAESPKGSGSSQHGHDDALYKTTSGTSSIRLSRRSTIKMVMDITTDIVHKVDPLDCTVMLSGAMLAACAGMTNGVAFRALGAFVSHVTGTLSRVGLNTEASAMSDAGDSLLLVMSFAIGSAICGCMITRNTVSFGFALYGLALIANAVLLALAVLTSEHKIAPYLLAAACGLQNGMATSYSGAVIRTTHVTGLCTDIGLILGRNSLAFFRKRWSRDFEPETMADHTADGRKLLLLLILGTAFLVGVFLGAALHSVAGVEALLLPAGITGTAGAVYTFYRTCWLHQPLMKSTESASKEANSDLPVVFVRPSMVLSTPDSGGFYTGSRTFSEEVRPPHRPVTEPLELLDCGSSLPAAGRVHSSNSQPGLSESQRSISFVDSRFPSNAATKSPRLSPRNVGECQTLDRLLSIVDALEPSLGKIVAASSVPGQSDLQVEAMEAHKHLRSVLQELNGGPDSLSQSSL